MLFILLGCLSYIKHHIISYMNLFTVAFAANKCSLEIDYKQFIYVHPNIAIWLADAPQSVLEVMEDVAKNVVFNLHPNYKLIHQKIYVRITNLPVYDQIRNIRYGGDSFLWQHISFLFLSSLFSSCSNDVQADSFEYHDPYWRGCDPTLWGVSPVATSKV